MLDMTILVSVVTLGPCADYAWWVFLFLPAFLLPYHVYRSADMLVIGFSIQSCVASFFQVIFVFKGCDGKGRGDSSFNIFCVGMLCENSIISHLMRPD